jgi:hypothetical protein
VIAIKIFSELRLAQNLASAVLGRRSHSFDESIAFRSSLGIHYPIGKLRLYGISAVAGAEYELSTLLESTAVTT